MMVDLILIPFSLRVKVLSFIHYLHSDEQFLFFVPTQSALLVDCDTFFAEADSSSRIFCLSVVDFPPPSVPAFYRVPNATVKPFVLGSFREHSTSYTPYSVSDRTAARHLPS